MVRKQSQIRWYLPLFDSSFSGSWKAIDDKQGIPVACLCNRQPPPFLKLRGLCRESKVDTNYLLLNNRTDIKRIELVGLHTRIYRKGKLWEQYDNRLNISGYSKSPEASYTLGKHNWTIMGDKECGEPEYTRELKMSGCGEEYFTCNDGQCIEMLKRCDQSSDCRDRSDEQSCNLLVLENGYNKNIPPFISGIGEAANVSVSIDLLKLVDIKEEEYSIEIQFQITLQWKEHRATYHNLKPKVTLNSLRQEDVHKVWLPEVIYENTDQKDTTRLGDGNWEWSTRLLVRREGAFTRSGPDMLEETEIFEGLQNSLLMSQTYTREFQCAFEFVKYPFDTQICSIQMAMGVLDNDTVRLVPDQVQMIQDLDMPIFHINDWKLVQETYRSGKTGVTLELVLKRKVTSELMTTYFPSCLLIAITFATTFFKPFFFEAALSVNLTTMLVMTTIFISKMESLPPTSDIKMIDIWLILCQMVPFAEVVLLTAMEYHRRDHHSKIVKEDVLCVADEDDVTKIDVEETQDRRCSKSWLPDLKTTGR